MFSDYLKNWKGHVIAISLRFGELDISNEEQAMLRYITGSDKNEGSLTWFCIPDTITRKKIEKASVEKKLSDVLDSLTIDNYVSFVTCGSDIDYLNDDEYEKIVGKIEEGIKEKDICVLAPSWWLLYPFSSELQSRLPDIKFDAPDNCFKSKKEYIFLFRKR